MGSPARPVRQGGPGNACANDGTACENERLRTEVERLRAQVAALSSKLALLTTHASLARGIAGESLVAGWIQGVLTTHNARHDLVVAGRKLRIEVKYSGLGPARRNLQREGRETLRWAWSKPFGESGKKEYDRLILVGDVDPRYGEHYRDPACPYILFDVPFAEIMPLTIRTNGGRYRSIQLTSNPRTARSAASALFAGYQVTLDELARRYGL
jgi:hypothetical protein